MSTTIANDEVMRFMIPSPTKERFQDKCARSGQKMSERMRYLVMRDIEDTPTPSERLSDITMIFGPGAWPPRLWITKAIS